MMGASRVLIPPGLFVWSWLAYAQWKTNGGRTFYVGYAAAMALVLDSLLWYLTLQASNAKIEIGDALSSLDFGSCVLVALLICSAMLGLKRYKLAGNVDSPAHERA